MRVTVVRPGDLGPGEASLWATFQRSSPVTLNPFLSLTFARVVGRSRHWWWSSTFLEKAA